MFSILENEIIYWQQALCLRLYFGLHAPLSRFMAAKWEEISVNEPRYFGFDRKKINAFRWVYTDRSFRNEIFIGKPAEILLHLYKLNIKYNDKQEYCFPSEHGRSVGHIRSIDTVWHGIIHKFGMKYISPVKLRKQLHREHIYSIDDSF